MTDIVKETGTHQMPADAVIHEMAMDYSGYLDMDATKERQVFYDSIEEMLTKLDEFGAMVDAIRGDTRLCVNETVPNIQTKCEEMKHIFSRVDQLEVFVNIVKQNVNTMEEQVNKAENEMGSFSGIKKMFSSLVGSKKSATPRDQPKQYEAPEIFVTEEYLKPVRAVEVLEDQPVTDNNQSKVADSTSETVTQETDKTSSES